MKKCTSILIALLLAATAFGRLDLNAQLIDQGTLVSATAITATEYPDADILVVNDMIRIAYEKSGSYNYINDVALKILTEKGRQERSTISLGYDAAYGTMRFVRAERVRPDGSTVSIDVKKQSREAISAGQMGSNIYDPNSKEIKLTVPGLEIGDVLRYTYSSEQAKTVVPGTWSDIYTLEEACPVLKATYEVTAPASLPLKRIELRDEVPDTVTFKKENIGEQIRYTWTANNVPQMFPEPQMPERHTVVQRLVLSTIPDWESLSKWYWELSKPRLEKVNDALIEKVKELTEGIPDRQKQIESIFRFVSQDIRYMGITIEDEAPGYEPHDVCLTFDNRYGVCRDKAALLAAMLRQAGFDAYPVLIYVGPKKDPDVPQPWFNHAITAVRNADGSYQLMDSTNENTRDLFPAYLDNCSYLVAHPDGETLQTAPVTPPEKNLLSIEIDASLAAGGLITGEADLSFKGINDTAYRGRLAGLKPDERKPYFEQRLKDALGNARLTRLTITPEEVRDTTQPLSVTLAFEVENSLTEGSTESLLKIPTLVNRFGLFGAVMGNGIGLDKRRYPLNTSITCGVKEAVRLDLGPSGLGVAALPSFKTIDSPEISIRREISENGNILTSTANLMLRTVEFTPKQYQELKQGLKDSEHNARKQVILTPTGFPKEADLATLESKVLYQVANPHNWTETRTVRKKVLTYAGKKSASDIKMVYNPPNQTAFLGDATVTAPDGTVHQIDHEKEVNEMDAPWAGKAPRYPAGKIKVVNLPGVEIGSIIEYTITRVYRDQPFFSTHELFSGLDPIAEKTVELQIPRYIKIDINNTQPPVIPRRTSLDGDTSIYKWHVTHQKMIKKEEQMPPLEIFAPALYISSGDIKTHAKTLKKALKTAAEPTNAIKVLAKELTGNLKEKSERITAIRDFVDQSIRAAGPKLPQLPLSAIFPAEQVLSEGYGNTSDRAVLLYALCDAAKLKPRFVLTTSLPRPAQLAGPSIDVLQNKRFDTVLVAVEDNDQIYYLGDSSQYAKLGTLAHRDRPAINLENGEIETLQSSLTDSVQNVQSLTVQDNGDVLYKSQMKLSGTAFEALHKRFEQFTPENRRREYQQLLSGLSQTAEAVGDLKTDFSYPGTLEFAATLPQYAVREGEHLYLTLPGGLGNLLNLKTSERDNLFHIRNAENRQYIFEIQIPDGWEPILLPQPFTTVLPENAGTVQVLISRNHNQIKIVQNARIEPAIILPEEYSKLLRLNNRLTDPSANTILLRKKTTPAKK